MRSELRPPRDWVKIFSRAESATTRGSPGAGMGCFNQ